MNWLTDTMYGEIGESARSAPPPVPEFPRLDALLRLGHWAERRARSGGAAVLRKARAGLYWVATNVVTLTALAPKPMHDWVVPFPRTEGRKGEIKHIPVLPQCFFKGEKLIAQDNSGQGLATRVTSILVGQKLQLPHTGDGGVLTQFFDRGAVGNGNEWDTCDPALHITISVQFLEDGWWEGCAFGKAVF